MKKIAIIGSRKMSPYGKEVIDKLLITNYQLLIKNNIEIVTIGVAGCNDEVIRKCGEKKLKCKVFFGNNFEELNSNLANYADLLVIIEGGEASGTILAAKCFLDLGKEVAAVPGKITEGSSMATNFLIANGAKMITEVKNFLEELV